MAFNIFQKKKDTRQADAGFAQTKQTDFHKKSAISGADKDDSLKDAKIISAGSATILHDIILRPRITEKATIMTESGAYAFNVAPSASKVEIKKAISEIYKVTPKKIRVAKIKSKNVRNRKTGVRGVKSGGKKAYVYLKEGESINLV